MEHTVHTCRMKAALAVIGLVWFSSCATVFSGLKAPITVTSPDATRAELVVDGKPYGSVTFPAEIKVKRGYKPSTIEATNGNMKGSVVVEKKFNKMAYWNAIVIYGWIIDAADGAIMEPTETQYTIRMSRTQSSSQPNQQTVQQPEEPQQPSVNMGKPKPK